ncbi:hypothetical protein P3X46_000654 [Hevea brasiliensis]|uniref:Retrotransposon gag domain-containing protein n=1 Tax=Hevea brasiliensis TaxID=3981 RepID=A0ABQ9NA27_HEVBR|nr:hypothetical protein P3X46_000654 [Hevea brasiliensis]
MLDKYDGTTDPRSHVVNFRTIMMLQIVNDYHFCWVFLTILTGLAQKWYQHLRPELIQNFHQLTTGFKNKDYIANFNIEATQIENLNHKIACKALKKDMRNIKFLGLLIKNLAIDYYQLLERAQKYIRLEDK